MKTLIGVQFKEICGATFSSPDSLRDVALEIGDVGRPLPEHRDVGGRLSPFPDLGHEVGLRSPMLAAAGKAPAQVGQGTASRVITCTLSGAFEEI